MGWRDDTLQRLQDRVAELIQGFGSYCDDFDSANLFTGPSLYFHFKTLARLRRYPSPIDALQDDIFLESLYATLTAWGMHRMGRGGAKLVDFNEMVHSFRNQGQEIAELATLKIWELTNQRAQEISEIIWKVISELNVGVGETKIVAGSKALHHLLPELLPPIDREYTIRFFFHHTTLNRGDRLVFMEIYPAFHQVALSCREQIEPRLGKGMHTSYTKVIDNAIVGYGLRHFKKRGEKG